MREDSHFLGIILGLFLFFVDSLLIFSFGVQGLFTAGGSCTLICTAARFAYKVSLLPLDLVHKRINTVTQCMQKAMFCIQIIKIRLICMQNCLFCIQLVHNVKNN